MHVPESILGCAQFQSLISTESWEINPFLDALILNTNIILDFSYMQTSTFHLTVICLWIHIHFWYFLRPEKPKKEESPANKYVVFSMCTCELAAISHFSHDP